ncbi:MAG: FHA domain-containing protein [Anaerolineaceae bacterium]|jgi:pSer/pThr/pTyr-binding forkhead associated (FHA) protein|nr:FHA domain-containing protein [Anaerolineaceae bacterium]
MTAIFILILRIILAILLLGFVGLLFFTTWRQLQTQVKLLSPDLSSSIHISYKDNPEQEAFVIKQTDVLVGRDPNCKVHIPDETISAQHARVYLVDQNWWVQDLNSTNGTFLNDERIDQPCILADNDMLQIGNVKLIIHTINS